MNINDGSSSRIGEEITTCILHTGRILNRFSKDLGTVDDPLVSNLLDAVTVSSIYC